MITGLTKNKFKLVFTKYFNDISPEIVSVQLPSISLDAIKIPSGISPINEPGGEIVFSPFDISFLVTKDLSVYKKFINWFFSMRNPEERKQNNIYEQVTLQIYTPDGKLLRGEIQFDNVFPTDISGILFEAQAQETPEVATVTFTYDNYKFI